MRKKLVISIFIVSILLLSSLPVLAAQTDSTRVNLTRNQKNILREYGLNDNQIKNISMDEIRNLLANGTPTNTSSMSENTKSICNDAMQYVAEMETKLKQKGLSSQNIDVLQKMGYSYEETLKMGDNELKKILSKTSIPFGQTTPSIETGEMITLGVGTCPICYSHPAPTNMGYVSSVNYFGGTAEYFDPAVYPPDINIYDVPRCMTIAEKMYNLTYNYASTQNGQNLRFSYYLWGEWGECSDYWGLHEGVDLQSQLDKTRTVHALTPGTIVLLDRNKKWMNVHDPNLGVTINYQHLSSIPESLHVGDTISALQNIGAGNTTDGHIHTQVCNHNGTTVGCTGVHSGYDHDYILSCVRPYQYLRWYL